jgi:HEAT repeat protein
VTRRAARIAVAELAESPTPAVRPAAAEALGTVGADAAALGVADAAR